MFYVGVVLEDLGAVLVGDNAEHYWNGTGVVDVGIDMG